MMFPEDTVYLRSVPTEWPYQVSVSQDMFIQWQSMCAWCDRHVGGRDQDWEWPTEGWFVFKKESDAMAFSLAWSGA